MDVQDTSIGLHAVSPSSAHVRDEASDAAAAAILASQMGPKFGACYLALIRTVQRARRRGYMGEAAAYEPLLSRMEAMAGVSSSIASVSAGTALLPTTARPATFVPMQEAPDSVPLPAAEISASFGVVVLREVLPCDTGADIVPAPAVSASSMECASSVGTGVVSPPDDGGSQIHVPLSRMSRPGWHHQQRSSQAPRSSVASRRARGRAVAGHGRKDGQAVVEWGTTVEHTVWGACARHALHQLNDNDN